MTTIIGVFSLHTNAEHAINELRAFGVPEDDISYVYANKEGEVIDGQHGDEAGEGAAEGGDALEREGATELVRGRAGDAPYFRGAEHVRRAAVSFHPSDDRRLDAHAIVGHRVGLLHQAPPATGRAAGEVHRLLAAAHPLAGHLDEHRRRRQIHAGRVVARGPGRVHRDRCGPGGPRDRGRTLSPRRSRTPAPSPPGSAPAVP